LVRVPNFFKNSNNNKNNPNIYIQSYKKAIESKTSVKVIDIIPAQEENLYLESIYTPIFNENGKCTHILFVSNDITEWKKKENELKIMLEKKESLLKAFQRKLNTV